MHKKSGNPKIEELTKSETTRQYSSGSVPCPKRDNVRYCVWCNEKPLNHGNQRYCSRECINNMMAWSRPQKEEGLGLLLIKQSYKCNICQFDWAPTVKHIIMSSRIPPVPRDFDFTTNFNWPLIKRLKSNSPEGRKPEVDHIVPISKGGQSLGHENHQAICYSCHKNKTKVDNSGPRNKKLTK